LKRCIKAGIKVFGFFKSYKRGGEKFWKKFLPDAACDIYD
jgi:hypothetical protein